MSAIAPIIIVLNVFGGIVGAIWAALSGDWWAIGYTILIVLAGHWVISLLLIPSFGIGAMGIASLERGRRGVARLALAFSTLWTTALMGAWAVFTTRAFVSHSRASVLFPVLLLAYGASTAPWSFLASRDRGGGNEFSIIGLFFLQFGYLIGGALLLLSPDRPGVFGMPLLASLVVNWVVLQIAGRELIWSALQGSRSGYM